MCGIESPFIEHFHGAVHHESQFFAQFMKRGSVPCFFGDESVEKLPMGTIQSHERILVGNDISGRRLGLESLFGPFGEYPLQHTLHLTRFLFSNPDQLFIQLKPSCGGRLRPRRWNGKNGFPVSKGTVTGSVSAAKA